MKFVAYNDYGEIVGSVSTAGLKNLYESSSHGDFDRVSFNHSVIELAKKADYSKQGSHCAPADLVGEILKIERSHAHLACHPNVHEIAQSVHASVADGIGRLINANDALKHDNEIDGLRAKVRTLEKDVKFYLNFDVEGLSEMAHDLIDNLNTFVASIAPVKARFR